MQNLAASWVSGLPRWTRTRDLLAGLGWLSIYQLSLYHSLLLIWKARHFGEPVRNVRMLDARNEGRIELTRRTLTVSADKLYWKLPINIRSLKKISLYKKSLKSWIKLNVPLEEGGNEY